MMTRIGPKAPLKEKRAKVTTRAWEGLKSHAQPFVLGWKDALQWKSVKRLLQGSPEAFRNTFLCFGVNALLMLVSFMVTRYDSFLLHLGESMLSSQPGLALPGRKVLMKGSQGLDQALRFGLLVYPFMALGFFVVQKWYEHTMHLLFPSKMKPTKIPKGDRYRTFLLINMSLETFLFRSASPFIGRVLALMNTCWLNTYYCFEFKLISENATIHDRMKYIEKYWLYSLGFAMPLTLITLMVPNTLSSTMFCFLLPYFMLAAHLATPISVHESHPTKPVAADASLSLPNELPIFAGIRWLTPWLLERIHKLESKAFHKD